MGESASQEPPLSCHNSRVHLGNLKMKKQCAKCEHEDSKYDSGEEPRQQGSRNVRNPTERFPGRSGRIHNTEADTLSRWPSDSPC